MTEKNPIRPGEDAVRHLSDDVLRDTVDIFSAQAQEMPEGSEAREIIEHLAAAGREELADRAKIDGKG